VAKMLEEPASTASDRLFLSFKSERSFENQREYHVPHAGLLFSHSNLLFHSVVCYGGERQKFLPPPLRLPLLACFSYGSIFELATGDMIH
jgi:hypothetical protein